MGLDHCLGQASQNGRYGSEIYVPFQPFETLGNQAESASGRNDDQGHSLSCMVTRQPDTHE